MNAIATGAILTLTSLPMTFLPADEPVEVAIIQDKDIDESSGIAISYANPGCLWLHNDSGDKPDLFLVEKSGETRAVVRVDDVDPFDWEDMCSFRIDGQSWLLIGDVGDNGRDRGKKKTKKCRLLLLPEPRLPEKTKSKTRVDVTAEIKFEYEDGRWNCESVAVDVERGEILLLTKELPGTTGLYVLPLDLTDKKQERKAQRIAAPLVPFATALDISPDGRTMVIGTMLNGIVYRRSAQETWAQAVSADDSAHVIPLPIRRQGETICFDQTGQWLYLNSEAKEQPLWKMKLPPVPEKGSNP